MEILFSDRITLVSDDRAYNITSTMDEQTEQYYAEQAVNLVVSYAQVTDGVSRYFDRAFGKGDKVLDIGCGTGRDLDTLLSLGVDAVGVDPSQQLAEQALIAYPKLNGRIQEDELPTLTTVKDDSYDGVLCSAVLMHLPEEYLFDSIYSIRRVLRNRGSLLISLPDYDSTIDPDTCRDPDGRYFNGVTPEKIQLLLERVGFNLIDSWFDGDALGRKNRKWHTLLFRLESSQGTRSLDMIEAVLNRDRKVATYKPALIRALADIATTNSNTVQWLSGGKVSISIAEVSHKWVEYYWPIFESSTFIPQIQGESSKSEKPIAFRSMMMDLISEFRHQGGLAGFLSSQRNEQLSTPIAKSYGELLSKLNSTIKDGPVRHSGGVNSDAVVFHYDKANKSIVMASALWSELSMMGSWIQDSTVLRWAELTARISKGTVQASTVIDALLTRPDPERDVKDARGFYLKIDHLSCVWTDQSLSQKTLAVDHAIPYALWKNNALWNLLPAKGAVNGQKSDKLPTYQLMQSRKDAIIANWELMQTQYPVRFLNEGNQFTGRNLSTKNGNWQNVLFNTFCESVELTATQRGVERWAP